MIGLKGPENQLITISARDFRPEEQGFRKAIRSGTSKSTKPTKTDIPKVTEDQWSI